MESVTSKVKIVFIIIDGIGELNLPAYSNKTSLQIAKTPHMDALAASGLNGIMDPVETGLACGSDTAHMNIFDYNPFKLYRGRGAFESMGSGIPMDHSEIAFKCNFSHMDSKTGLVLKRRVDREFPHWGLELIDALNGMRIPGYEDHYITVLHATEHRCGVKVTGPNLCDKITGTDPLKDNLPLRKVAPKDKNDPDSVFTAKLVKYCNKTKKTIIFNKINALSDAINEKLTKHPINIEREKQGLPTANIVLLRGCGSRLKVTPFLKHHGLKGFLVAPTAIINGLGQTIELDPIKVPGTTGDYSSNLNLKSQKAAELLASKEVDYDFGFIHVKAVDDAGHDKSAEKKIHFLEKSDEMIKTLLDTFEKLKSPESELVIFLTGDHTTPVSDGDHTFQPVPIAVSTYTAVMNYINRMDLSQSVGRENLMKLRDSVSVYNEVDAAEGVLGRVSGREVFNILKSFKNTVDSLI